MSLTADLKNLGFAVDVDDYEHTLLSAITPTNTVYVRVDHETGYITIEVMPDDHEKQPLVINYSAKHSTLLDVVEKLVA